MKKIIYLLSFLFTNLFINNDVNGQSNCSAYFSDSTHLSNGCVVDFYHFNNNSTHTSFLSYNFGDGTSGSNTTSPSNFSITTHTYTSSGWYNVCLTMWDSSFCQNSYCDSIYVNCGGSSNCSAHFVDTIHNGCSVTFNYSTPWPKYLGYQFHWTFGDGNSLSGNPTSNPNIPYPTHTYSTSGWYNVCLSILDSANQCQAYYCDSIYVNCNGSQNCNVNWSNSIQNCNVNFVSTVSPSSNGWNYLWNFGDGNSSNQANPSHTYSSNGTYNVCLTVWNNLTNCSDTLCKTIQITNCNGTSCMVNPTVTVNQCNAQFYSYATPTGSGWNYYWSFGDGGTSSLANPNHSYSSNGTYVVCLTAWNTITNCSDSSCFNVQINNCGGSSNCQVMFTTFDSACYTYFIPTVTPFNPNYNYVWNFGNGNSSNQQYPVHQYNAPGLYYACVTIWDSSSTCQATYCDTVAVNCVPNSVNEISSLKDFKLYPNPAKNQINIALDLIKSEEVNIFITDVSGRVVGVILENQYLYSGNRVMEYNISNLNSGIYFVSTIVGSEISVHKFIKH